MIGDEPPSFISKKGIMIFCVAVAVRTELDTHVFSPLPQWESVSSLMILEHSSEVKA